MDMKWLITRLLFVAVLFAALGFAVPSSVSADCPKYSCGEDGDECTPDSGDDSGCVGSGDWCFSWGNC